MWTTEIYSMLETLIYTKVLGDEYITIRFYSNLKR